VRSINVVSRGRLNLEARFGSPRHGAPRLAKAPACASLFLAIALILPPTAYALVIQPLSVRDMARMADTVALVRIDSVQARRTSAGAIETVCGIRTLETLKGSAPSSLGLPGGTVDGVTMRVDGTPRLTLGETCLLFLDARKRIIGGPQGRLTVSEGYVPGANASLAEIEARVRGALSGQASAGTPSGRVYRRSSAASLARLAAPPARTLRPLATDVFFDDFESGTMQWEVGNTSSDPGAQWTLSTVRASSPTHSMYCSGVRVDGGYPDYATTWMLAGPFDLSGASGATLSFDTWYDTEPGYDYFTVFVTTDKVNFTEAGTYDGSSNGWVAKQIDLAALSTDFTGEPQVWIDLEFKSDESSDRVYEGVYVDDVRVSAGGGSGQGPAITAITPGTASAGTGTTVTISGTGFGATRGNVEFSFDAPSTVQADVVSWSDTRIVCSVPVYIVDDRIASASSGPVSVVDSGGARSNGFPFKVTFGWEAMLWPGRSTTYRVNANYPGIAGELDLVKAAASTWGAASAFKFDYSGTCGTGDFGDWDGRNDVFWTDSLPDGVYSQTARWWSGNRLLEADLGLSASASWGDGTNNTLDVQTVVTHEFGHWLALCSLYGPADSSKVMYGDLAPGVVKRTLAVDDIAGAVALYGKPGTPVDRNFDSVEGAGRIKTAVQACQRAFTTSGSAETIVLATSANWPDALGGAPLAGVYGAPLLLTLPDRLSPEVLDEAERLNAKYIVILGSDAAISTNVESALKKARVNAHALTVIRIGGAGRYETARLMAKTTVEAANGTSQPYDGVAFFATGLNFPDALAASPIAARKRWPILLVKQDSVPSETEKSVTDLKIKNGIMLGSDRAISPAVARKLQALLPNAPNRLFGTDRYGTGIAIARFGALNGLHWDGIAIATGTNFPDALAGGVMQGRFNSLMLLTPGGALNPSVRAELTAHKGDIGTVRYLGSTTALSRAVRSAVAAALK
jgi:putative cell wall-binding protein